MTAHILTQAELKTQLHYNPETGIFTRLKNNTECHTVNSENAVLIFVNKKRYLAHRLAWLYVYGELPDMAIDHINRCRTDNRISNLRLATLSQNQQNRKPNKGSVSGIKGVTWHHLRNKWRVRCTINGKSYHLGDYPDLEIAKYAYQAFAKEHHGEFYSE